MLAYQISHLSDGEAGFAAQWTEGSRCGQCGSSQAYKPRREVFGEALRVSICTPGEVVHIGDFYDTDVVGAPGAGIRPILLQRRHIRRHGDVGTADDLEQALELIFKKVEKGAYHAIYHYCP